MRFTKLNRVAALAFALSLPAFSAALSQTPSNAFDGQWVLDVTASPVIAEEDSVCPAVRLPVRIQGGQLVGSLTQVPTITGGVEVEEGWGPRATPIIGSVGPDGAVQAQWENYHASGKLSGDSGEFTVQTECGPAAAHAMRVLP